MSVNDRDVTSHRDIANALADNFSHNSYSAFSTDTCTYVRHKAEKQRLNINLKMLKYTTGPSLRFCLKAFRSSVDSLHVDAHEPNLGARCAKRSLHNASKIKSLPKHSTHDNKYMKLSYARPNAIGTFGIRIKQFLIASNIDFSDVLETPSYFLVNTLMYQTTEDCAGTGAPEERCMFISSFSWKYETGTMITFLFIQMVHEMEFLWLVLVCPSTTVISMRLPDSASVFTAEVWAIIKALEQIKDSVASKYIIFTDSLSCLQALQYMKLDHPLIGMVIRKSLFLNFTNKILHLNESTLGVF